jgi:hypothetical protein
MAIHGLARPAPSCLRLLACGDAAERSRGPIDAYLHESGMTFVLHYRRIIAIGRKLAAENHGGPS